MEDQKIHPVSFETSAALARNFYDIMALAPNKGLSVNRRPYHKLQSLSSPFRMKIYADISKKAYELVTKLQAISLRLRAGGARDLNQITLTID